MMYKILRQSDLYHNPDPLYRLVGEINESAVLVEGQKARASYRLWFSVIIHLTSLGKEIKINSTTTSFCVTD